MANVGFKRGSQSALNTLITNVKNDNSTYSFNEGTFYLTDDTDRLYFAQGVSELVELNKSITVVDKMEPKTGDAAGTTYLPDTDIEEGQFYYIKNDNILCIYINSTWIQINPDTNDNDNDHVTGLTVGNIIEQPEYELASSYQSDTDYYTRSGSENSYTYTSVSDVTSENFNQGTYYKVKAKYIRIPLTITQEDVNDDAITPDIKANIDIPYTMITTASGIQVGIITNTNGSNQEIKLEGSCITENKEKIILTPGTNVSINRNNGTGALTFNAVDTTYTLSETALANNGGYRYSLIDSNEDAQGTTQTFYSTAQIDDKITTINNNITALEKTFDAMTYRGTISSTDFEKLLKGEYQSNNETVKIHNGDVYKLSSQDTGHTITGAKVGDLFIFKATEGADGTIAASTESPLTSSAYDIVPSGDDVDTQYEIVNKANAASALTIQDTVNSNTLFSLSGSGDISVSRAANSENVVIALQWGTF